MKEIKILKDKQGNKLTYKEFVQRWKKGITEITPIQKINTQLTGTKIMLIGLFLGLLIAIYGWKNLWWVAIILTGAFINTWVQYISTKQQKKILDNLEEQFKEEPEVKIEDEIAKQMNENRLQSLEMNKEEKEQMGNMVGGEIANRIGMHILKEEKLSKEEKEKPEEIKDKCIMSVDGKCTSDYSPLKCNGIDIPDDCTYALEKKGGVC